MSTNTPSMTFQQWWAACSLAAQSAVRDLLDGSAAFAAFAVGGESLVDTVLFCNRCRELTMARCLLRTWTEFDKQLAAKRLNCQCGGALVRELSPIILLN